MTLSARRVDITTLAVDAIVNAANEELLPGGAMAPPRVFVGGWPVGVQRAAPLQPRCRRWDAKIEIRWPLIRRRFGAAAFRFWRRRNRAGPPGPACAGGRLFVRTAGPEAPPFACAPVGRDAGRRPPSPPVRVERGTGGEAWGGRRPPPTDRGDGTWRGGPGGEVWRDVGLILAVLE